MSNETELFPDEQAVVVAFPATVVAIQAVSPEGYPITLTLNDPAQGAMKSWIALLQKQGFTAPAAGNPTTGAAAAPSGSAPVCPYHGPMKESTIKGKEGTYYCPKKMADGSYCKEKS